MQPDLSGTVGVSPERFVPGAATEGELVGAEHFARYGWATQLTPGRRVLDAGCGVGYGTNLLANAGAKDVVGVDLADEAVQAAAEAAAPRARFLPADVRELPFEDASFDLVVCFEVIEHVDGQRRALAEFARVLAPGGILAISSPNRGVYPQGNPHHVHEYVPEELREELAAHFPHVELRRQHAWISSSILDDAQAATAELDLVESIVVAKLVGAEPGSEPYTLALASDAPLPKPRGWVALTAIHDVKSWVERVDEQRDRAQQLERRLGEEIVSLRAELVASDDALDVERGRVRDAERRIDDALAELNRTQETLRGVYASIYWRLTEPLRMLRRLLP
jgi:SAM-dependent methyltransferase